MTEMNPIVRYQSSKPSRKNAIHAMCASCMGCNETHMEAGFRNDIKNCVSVRCPLHAFRPYQDKEDATTHTA